MENKEVIEHEILPQSSNDIVGGNEILPEQSRMSEEEIKRSKILHLQDLVCELQNSTLKKSIIEKEISAKQNLLSDINDTINQNQISMYLIESVNAKQSLGEYLSKAEELEKEIKEQQTEVDNLMYSILTTQTNIILLIKEIGTNLQYTEVVKLFEENMYNLSNYVYQLMDRYNIKQKVKQNIEDIKTNVEVS